ncbi:DUF5590 domain-containing protein [Lapidilactobacillus mulanensis]|uniref:DUF5590 domain-containing protein n=1 Tax=Lapidilactobacillus mulanensis TaxID=2485999 RepID=A0ABW4DQW1_9LACO|nr:DUF5590 domain-containing protein [Lapidilactobacillus mulanensis]
MARNHKRGIIVGIIAAILLLVGVYLVAAMPKISVQQQSERIATKAADLTEITDFMTYNRKQTYYTVAGRDQNDQLKYVVINGKNGKIKIYAGKNAFTKSEVTAAVKKNYRIQKIYGINLGLNQGQPVWEISMKNTNGKLSYVLLDFHNGKQISAIDNL